MRILMIIGITQYDVLNYFARELGTGFEKQGCTVEYLERITESEVKRIKSLKFDFAVSFNGIGMTGAGKKQILNDENTIVWNFLVDHPPILMERLERFSYNSIVSFVDNNHVVFAEKNLKNLEYITFMPHGGSEWEEKVPYEARQYDVVFAGSYFMPGIYEGILERFDDDIKSLMLSIVHKLHKGTDTYENLVQETFEACGVEFDEQDLITTLRANDYLDKYARNINRVSMLEELAQNQIHVHIWGNGWEYYANKYPEYLHFHPSQSYEEMLQTMANAKIVLNNLPLFRDGSHERVFSAMLCGAVCFTEASEYFRKEFVDNEDIIFFDYVNLHQLSQKVKIILDDPLLGKAIAENGYQKAKASHTWEHRAEAMLPILCQIKQAQQERQQQEQWVRVEEQNCYAADYNNVMQLVQRVDEMTLFEKMKHYYCALQIDDREYQAKLEDAYGRFPYWGKLSYEKKEYESQQQRAHLLKANMQDFNWLYDQLGDTTSRRALCKLLEYWIEWGSVYLASIKERRYVQFFDLDIISGVKDEVFVDVGTYCGETVFDYITYYPAYQKVYCYEKEQAYMPALQEKASRYENVIVRNCLVGDKSDMDAACMDSEVSCVTLDEDIQEAITFLKVDAEGAEENVLKGARNHIIHDMPKLAVAVYYSNDAIIKIPRLIHEINPNYKFYLRYYGGEVCPNRMILYAVPQER